MLFPFRVVLLFRFWLLLPFVIHFAYITANMSMATITATMPPINSLASSSSLRLGSAFLLPLALNICIVFILFSFRLCCFTYGNPFFFCQSAEYFPSLFSIAKVHSFCGLAIVKQSAKIVSRLTKCRLVDNYSNIFRTFATNCSKQKC